MTSIQNPSAGNVGNVVHRPNETAFTPKKFFAEQRCTGAYNEIALDVPIGVCAGNAILNIGKTYSDLVPSTGASLLSDSSYMKVLGNLRIAGASVGIAAAIYVLIEQGIEIDDEITKGRSREGIDAGLRMIEATSDLCGATHSLSQGWKMTQGMALVEVAQFGASWASVLGVVGAGLSVASIIFHARGVIQSNEVQQMLEQDTEKACADLRHELYNFEKGDGELYLRRHFEIINREKYAAQVLHIIEADPTSNDAAIPVGKHAIAKKEMISALIDRVKAKSLSHKIAIVAAVISLIALFIFFFPVLGPAALAVGLMAAAAVVLVGRFAYDRYSIFKVQNKIDKLCDFSKIPHYKLPAFAKNLRKPPILSFLALSPLNDYYVKVQH